MTAAPRPVGGSADDGSHDAAAAGSLSARYDVALLDLDGVVYRGLAPVPGAPEALARARAAGMRLAFVTNNASRTPDQIARHLADLGVTAQPDEVVTSAQAAATLITQEYGTGRRVLVIGSDGLRHEIRAAGLVVLAAYDETPSPEVVVQGFSPDLRYEDLAQATLAVAAGAHWVATNTDLTLPTARGLQPGNGTLVAAVATATGRRPLVAGKPERALVDEAVRRSGAHRPLMIGDRLDTDIEGAVRAGMDSLLVLTGVSTLADVLAAAPGARPTYLGADLGALGTAQVPLADLPGAAAGQRSGWRAERREGMVELTREDGPSVEDDTMGLIRTLVVAAWAVADAGQRLTSVVVPDGYSSSLAAAGVPAAMLSTTRSDNGVHGHDTGERAAGAGGHTHAGD